MPRQTRLLSKVVMQPPQPPQPRQRLSTGSLRLRRVVAAAAAHLTLAQRLSTRMSLRLRRVMKRGPLSASLGP
jgi:hypothetical protein